MALLTLTPPNGSKFSTGTSESHSPRVLRADFGDGYAQRAGDGTNTDLGKLKPVFSLLTRPQGQALMDFFAAHKAYVPFLFALPGETTARKWIAKTWDRTFTGRYRVEISAEFEEVADPS